MEKLIIGILILVLLYAVIAAILNYTLTRKSKFSFEDANRIQNRLLVGYVVTFIVMLLFVLYF